MKYLSGQTIKTVGATAWAVYRPEFDVRQPWIAHALGENEKHFETPWGAKRYFATLGLILNIRGDKPPFNYPKMRKTFYEWHGGQDSALYAAASSGLVESVPGLQAELRRCAVLVFQDEGNFRHYRLKDGTIYQSQLKAHAYKEEQYLLYVALCLPDILGPEFKHEFDGRVYRRLPWAS